MRELFRGSFFFLWTTTLWAGTLPETLWDPLWEDAFEFLATEETFPSFPHSTRPFPLGEVRRLMEKAQPKTPWARELLATWKPSFSEGFFGRFSAELCSGRPAFRAAFRHGETLYQEWDILSASGLYEPVAGGETASQRLRPWNPNGLFGEEGYVADFRRTFLRLSLGGVAVVLGRQVFRWGPGSTGTLLLSDASPPLDGVSVSGLFGRVWGTAVFAALNPIWHDDGIRRYLARRYFAAHRLDWAVSRQLEIGVMDAVLYGGDARPIEWHYLNPLLPFYASQFNASVETNPDFQDDNVLIGFDARWRPSRGWSFYGEVLFDDFRYDPSSNDPHALAYLVGVHRTGIAERGEVGLEYVRIGRYTYTHLVPEQQYTHFGASIGYPTGNDADCFLLRGAWWWTPRVRLGIEYRQTRKGDSGVGDRFRGETNTSFLKDVAETRRELTLIGRARLANHFRFESVTALQRVRHRGHLFNDNPTFWHVRGCLAYEFFLGRK